MGFSGITADDLIDIVSDKSDEDTDNNIEDENISIKNSGLKNKPCKCNFPKINANTKNTVKEGNAEERPDAGCKIYGEEQRIVAAFFFTGIFQADKPREFEGSALNSRQAANLSSKKIAN